MARRGGAWWMVAVVLGGCAAASGGRSASNMNAAPAPSASAFALGGGDAGGAATVATVATIDERARVDGGHVAPPAETSARVAPPPKTDARPGCSPATTYPGWLAAYQAMVKDHATYDEDAHPTNDAEAWRVLALDHDDPGMGNVEDIGKGGAKIVALRKTRLPTTMTGSATFHRYVYAVLENDDGTVTSFGDLTEGVCAPDACFEFDDAHAASDGKTARYRYKLTQKGSDPPVEKGDVAYDVRTGLPKRCVAARAGP